MAQDDSDPPCETECVRTIHSLEEFEEACKDAARALIVIDFFKTSCGACKYIQPGFKKLCMSAQTENSGVVFLKHNVYDDELEELTELARHLKIKNVPMFQFYKVGELIDEFATRDRKRIAEAIDRHKDRGEQHVNYVSGRHTV